MMKIDPKMLSFENVLVLRWKICDTCEKSLWTRRGGKRKLGVPQTRGKCSTAQKFESSQRVHESHIQSRVSSFYTNERNAVGERWSIKTVIPAEERPGGESGWEISV